MSQKIDMDNPIGSQIENCASFNSCSSILAYKQRSVYQILASYDYGLASDPVQI